MNKEKLIEFIHNSDFIYADPIIEHKDKMIFKNNIRIMKDAIAKAWASRYLEWLIPEDDMNFDPEFLCANYYDSSIDDIVVFDTHILRYAMSSPEELVRYLITLDEKCSECKKQFLVFKDFWNGLQ